MVLGTTPKPRYGRRRRAAAAGSAGTHQNNPQIFFDGAVPHGVTSDAAGSERPGRQATRRPRCGVVTRPDDGAPDGTGGSAEDLRGVRGSQYAESIEFVARPQT